MADIVSILQSGASNPWFYLPVAVVLGAIHALEPGHSKSLMAAFIIAVKGTELQALILGLSAAIGHSIIVWALALTGLYLGDKLIVERAEPWLVLASGILILLLALRLYWKFRPRHDDHGHDHSHHESDDHARAHASEIATNFAGRRDVSTGEIIWFGFTGGMLPCPSAIAVLLACIQLRAYGLGIAMVFAFSFGLALTMVAVGMAAAAGAGMARARFSAFERYAEWLPVVSSVFVGIMGLLITLRGAFQLGLF